MCRFFRLIIFTLLFAILPMGGVYGGDLPPAIPTTSARAAILMDEYGQVLYAHNADASLPMASTTKIMTALVAIESGDVERLVKIPAEAVGVEGSSAYLIAGEEMRISELLYALMLESANDAAVALAVTIAGSVEAFARRMNDQAERLGLTSTHFVNPHGLDHEEHYTSARDLATLTAYALKNETFAQIVSTIRYSAPVAESDTLRLYVNHNRLLREYEGCIGVKTGYTKRCGRCLVTAARRNGITLIAVTLDDPNDWRDHRALLDFGFASCRETVLASAGEIECAIPVVGGDALTVHCQNIEALGLTLPEGTKATVQLEVPRFIWGKVSKGEQIGQAVYTVNGRVAAILPIYAQENVDAKVYEKGILQKIGDFLLRIWKWLAELFS